MTAAGKLCSSLVSIALSSQSSRCWLYLFTGCSLLLCHSSARPMDVMSSKSSSLHRKSDSDISSGSSSRPDKREKSSWDRWFEFHSPQRQQGFRFPFSRRSSELLGGGVSLIASTDPAVEKFILPPADEDVPSPLPPPRKRGGRGSYSKNNYNNNFNYNKNSNNNNNNNNYENGWVGLGGSGSKRRRRTQLPLPAWRRELARQWSHRTGGLLENLPKINFVYDPLINFKIKQRFVMLGACITLGMDYFSDISQWRSYCAVEDTLLKGRFSLRGSELGWAKSWLLNLGLGEESRAKIKLRLGFNLQSHKVHARLRFRTQAISPFDIGDGVSCAGRLPLPRLLPVLRGTPLRVEYRLRIHVTRPPAHHQAAAAAAAADALRDKIVVIDGRSSGRSRRSGKGGGEEGGENMEGLADGEGISRTNSQAPRQARDAFLTTGIQTIDLSLDELNFCMEFDEHSPLWGIGLVRSDYPRKGVSGSSGISPPGISAPRMRIPKRFTRRM